MSLAKSVQNKLIKVVPIRPDGTPAEDVDSFDPGMESDRAQSAMKLAILGPVLLTIGWLLMNVNNLIVGCVAFGLRLSILVTAPVAMLVGSNELKALLAGRRPESIKAQASMARLLGGLGFLFVLLYGLWLFKTQYSSR